MKKLFILAVCLTLFSCAGLPKQKSVCDDMIEPSVLCELAGKYDIRLETAGDIILVVNLRAIKLGAYEQYQAARFFNDLKHELNTSPVAAADLKKWVLQHVAEIPELLLVSPYLTYMETPQLLTNKDIEMLNWWIDYNLQFVEEGQ
jgi:hypothetical protein